MASILQFKAWLAKRAGNYSEAIRLANQQREINEWNSRVEAGKISRKGHRKS